MSRLTLTMLFVILAGILTGCAVHKTYGPYEGKVVDAETGQPIEGAALYMVFYTQTGTPGGSNSVYAGSKEVVTDSEGKFNLTESLWTFRPFHCWDEQPQVCLFKPGYGIFPVPPAITINSIQRENFATINLKPLANLSERRKNLWRVRISPEDPKGNQSELHKLQKEEIRIIEALRKDDK